MTPSLLPIFWATDYSLYEYLVARGDVGKAELDRLETMFANLRPEDKAKLDAMTLPELVEQDSLLIYGRRGLELDYLFASAADKARIDYSKLRFEELMAQEIIDWRDPQYMEKLNAYVNETGLDPRTGKEASDDVKFVAEHYGWVKGSSTLVASIADGVIDYSDLFKFKGLKETPSERVEIPDSPVNSQRERILKNIEESRKAREASKFGDYVKREKFLSRLFKNLSPEDSGRVLDISESAPKVEYIPGTYSSQDILDIKPNANEGIFRPPVEDYLDLDYIEAHKKQFENGAIKFQKFTPEEGGFNNGAIGNPKDRVAFVMPKEVGEILLEVSKGDPRLLEDLLGLHPGDLGDSPVVIDIPAESIRNPRIPSGNEDSAFEGYWKPGGRTYPGNMPEAIIDEVPWGEFTIRQLGGN